MIRKSTLATLVLSGFLFVGEASFAQKGAAQNAQPVADRETPASLDEEIALMRSDLRANRKKVIAANMKLTPDEAQWFWPTYNQYVDELVKINKAKYDLIKEYMDNTNMTEEQADGLSKRWVEVDESVVQLRLKIHSYIPKDPLRERHGDVLSTRPARSNDDRSATGQFASANTTLNCQIQGRNKGRESGQLACHFVPPAGKGCSSTGYDRDSVSRPLFPCCCTPKLS